MTDAVKSKTSKELKKVFLAFTSDLSSFIGARDTYGEAEELASAHCERHEDNTVILEVVKVTNVIVPDEPSPLIENGELKELLNVDDYVE